MGVGELYGFVLLIVLVSILIGVGVTVLIKLAGSTGVVGKAEEAINGSIAELAGISTTWLGIMVTVAVMVIILGMVMAIRAVRSR